MVASFVGGRIFLINPYLIFWVSSASAILCLIMFVFFNKINYENVSQVTNTSEKISFSDVKKIFKIRNFWILGFFYMGVSAIYDVFDQQFVIFFQQFFSSVSSATTVYSNTVTIQMFIEIILMLIMPKVVNKIGPRNGLLIYGFVTALRIIGTALSPNYAVVVALRLLAGFEMPLVLISIMKYIGVAFDNMYYATVYALTANFMKQVSVFIFSALAGNMYDSLGFQMTYLIMGSVVLIISIIALLFLEKPKYIYNLSDHSSENLAKNPS
ncbi:Lactose permease [Lactococcus cremoris]|nr:Lactose permease [Lactococcus cremoris]